MPAHGSHTHLAFTQATHKPKMPKEYAWRLTKKEKYVCQHCISVMRAELLKLSIFAPKKRCGERTVNRSEIPHYAYT